MIVAIGIDNDCKATALVHDHTHAGSGLRPHGSSSSSRSVASNRSSCAAPGGVWISMERTSAQGCDGLLVGCRHIWLARAYRLAAVSAGFGTSIVFASV